MYYWHDLPEEEAKVPWSILSVVDLWWFRGAIYAGGKSGLAALERKQNAVPYIQTLEWLFITHTIDEWPHVHDVPTG